jgi:hypothetical protein
MAMAGQLAAKPGLAAEGARVGAEFRIGACKAEWRGRRYAPRHGAGVVLLIVLASGVFVPPLATTGVARAIAGGLDAAIFAWGILLVVLPPRSWTDRLFLCQAGIVLLDARAPEPVVLRWAHLDTMSITTASGYDDDFVSSCVLRDQAGNALMVSRHLSAIAEVAAEAERVLAPRLVPPLIARFASGEPVSVGHLTIDRQGLSWGTAPGPPESGPMWEAPWPEIRAIEFGLQGQRVIVKAGQRARDSKSLAVDGQPNSFLIRYLVAHAAAIARITVTGHTANWDGESGRDPEATIAAPALPVPGPAPQAAFSEKENWRPARKRHPARTALVLAMATGILVGWALTFDHSSVVIQPGNSDNGDRIASLWHSS